MAGISIITPVYNAERYLPKCADGIFAQTFDDWEWIMIDDGSTDSSGKLCDKYAAQDKRITVIHTENRGASAARNAGLKKATGKYVMFCDSDDYYEPQFCQKMIAAMESNNAEIAVSGTNVIADDNDSDHRKADQEYLRLKHSGLVAATDDVLLNTNTFHWNKIYRADILKKQKVVMPDGLKLADDNYFVSCYFMFVNNIYFLNEKLYNYRHSDKSLMGQATTNMNSHGADFARAAIMFYNFLKSHDLYELKRDYFWQAFFWWLGFSFFLEKSDPSRKDIIKMAKDFIAGNNITIDEMPAGLSRSFTSIQRDMFYKQIERRKLFGIIKINEARHFYKFNFLGLRLWKVKYSRGWCKYYLLGFILVWKDGTRRLASAFDLCY